MISARAKLLKPSPTLAMAVRAKELASAGRDVVSLTVGEPDWNTDSAVCEAGIAAIQSGFTKYTAPAGLPELREKVAAVMGEELRLKVPASQVVIGAGAKYVLFAALQMLIDPGDEVIIPAPYWVSYPTMVELAGGKPVFVSTNEASCFKLTPEGLKSAITSKTKMLILCSPSNPTGIAYTQNELSALAEVIRQHPNLVVLSDDIYNRLLFSDEIVAPHILHVAPDLVERVIAVSGASKSFSMTGWRVGWAFAPLTVAKVLADFLSQSTSNLCSISQKAAIKALENPARQVEAARKLLRERWSFFEAGLSQIQGLSVCPSDGAFYVWLNVQNWIGKTHRTAGLVVSSSAVLSELLLDQEAVATVPGIEFGVEGFIRLSFATSHEQLEKALARFRHFSVELR